MLLLRNNEWLGTACARRRVVGIFGGNKQRFPPRVILMVPHLTSPVYCTHKLKEKNDGLVCRTTLTRSTSWFSDD